MAMILMIGMIAVLGLCSRLGGVRKAKHKKTLELNE